MTAIRTQDLLPQLLVLAGAFALAGLIALIHTVPTYREIRESRAKIAEDDDAIAHMEAQTAELRARYGGAAVEVLKAELEQIQRRIPVGDDSKNIRRDLQKLLEQLQVAPDPVVPPIVTGQPRSAATPPEWGPQKYDEITYEVRFRTQWDKLGAFLTALRRSVPGVTLREASIARANVPDIDVDLKLSSFCSVPANPEEGGK